MAIYKAIPREPVFMRLSKACLGDRLFMRPAGSRPKEVQSTLGVRLSAYPFKSAAAFTPEW